MTEGSNMTSGNIATETSAAPGLDAGDIHANGARNDNDAGPKTDSQHAAGQQGDQEEADTEITIETVRRADIGAPEGCALVERYRQQRLKKLNSTIGFCAVEGKGVIVRVGRNSIDELGVQFLSVDTERLRLANSPIPFVRGSADPQLVWQPIFPEWLKWSGRRSYDGIVFRPKREVKAERRLPPFSRNGLAPLNLFVGTAWEPARGKCDLILQHIRDVWCGAEEEATGYVLNWLARMVQQPEKPAETVLVLRSGQGVGKGTITNIFRRYFGAHGIEITNDRELTGFNDHLATSIFISLNEAIWGGHKAGEGTLKSIITDPELNVERKYLPRFKIRNHTHLIVSSNSEWCVPVGHDDRRYAVLNPSEARKQDASYFTALHEQIAGGGDKALIQYLLTRDISGFNPRVLPKVQGDIKLEQKLRSANSVAQWVHGLLGAGGVDVQEAGAFGGSRNSVFVELTRAPITAQALHDDYVRATRGGRPEPIALWAKSLRKILGASLIPSRNRSGYRPTPSSSVFGGFQVQCYSVHDLDQARKAFAEHMGEDIDWL